MSERASFDEPRCFDVLLNTDCNARCLFCSQDAARRGPELPFEHAVRHVYAAWQKGFRRLGLTGGEPTLRPDLPKLLAFARKTGFSYIRLQTNGLKLADPDYARSLVRAGLTFVKLSVQGPDAATHDRLTGVPGSFDKCLKALANLRELKAGIGVNLVLCEDNCRRLEDFFRLFLLELKVSDFVLIAPIYEGEMGKGRAKGARLKDLAPFVRRAFDLFLEEGFPKPPLLLHFTPCLLPGYEKQMLGWASFNTLVVSPDGEVSDLDRSAQTHAVKAETCRRCVYDARCIGLEKSYADRFGTGELEALTQAPPSYDQGRQPADERRRRVLTLNEACVLEVLALKDGVDTRELLETARGIPLCRDCRDENAVLASAEALARMGRVARRFESGRYVWALVP